MELRPSRISRPIEVDTLLEISRIESFSESEDLRMVWQIGYEFDAGLGKALAT